MSRPRGKTIALASGAVAVATLLVTGILLREELTDWWYRIPVTRTWGDLLAARPIRLEDGTVVRLGIEARSCPRWSGVLLYCLTDRDRLRNLLAVNPIGPLRVSFEGDAPDEISADLMEIPRPMGTDSEYLFLRTLPAMRPGKLRWRVLTEPGGQLVARAVLEVLPTDMPPWMPLDRGRKQVKGAAPVSISSLGAGIALPAGDGGVPCRPEETRKGLADPQTPLPRLFPEGDSEVMRVEPRGDVLEVTSPEDISTGQPLRHFLARWWVNGAPHVPREVGPISMMEQIEARPTSGKRVTFRLDLDRLLLGIVKGDRVEVQLLYSDREWEHIQGRIERLHPSEEGCRVLLGNRVAVTLP